MTGKCNCKRAADRDSKIGPTQRKKRKESPWTSQLNDELTLCTADLTKYESDYDESLDPSAHLIHNPIPIDHDSDTVPVSIVTEEEDEDSDYVLNEDPLGKFDCYIPHQEDDIHEEFAPVRYILHESMLFIASLKRKDGQLQFKIILETNEHTWENFPDIKEYHPQATADYIVCNNVTGKKERDTDREWANHTIQDIRQTIRRTIKIYDFIMDKINRLYRVKRKVHGSKNKKWVDFTRKTFKYG